MRLGQGCASIADGQVRKERVCGENHAVVGSREEVRDVFSNTDASQLDESRIRLDSITDHGRSLLLTFGVNDGSLLLFLCTQNFVTCPLGLLKRYLLRFDSLLVVRTAALNFGCEVSKIYIYIYTCIAL